MMRHWFLGLCLSLFLAGHCECRTSQLTPLTGNPERLFCNSNETRRSYEWLTEGGTAKEGTPCCFPFTFEEEVYHSCTRAGHEDRQPWCYVGYQNLWGNCRQATATVTGTQEHLFCNEVGRQASQEYASVGGKAPHLTPCCFPFTHEGQTYSSCTSKEKGLAWCKVGYQELWGFCEPVTQDPPEHYFCSDAGSSKSQQFVAVGGNAKPGTPCCFPFVYKDETYHSCTTADNNDQSWCYVGYQNMWGVCERVA